MVVAFMLPEWLAGASEDPIGLMRGKSFQGSEPSSRRNVGCYQQMNVIRHNHEGVELVTMKPAITGTNSFNYQRRNFRNGQVSGPGFRAIQDTVHRDERLAAGQAFWREDAIGGQAIVQAECNEQGLAHRVPVRQAPLVVLHITDVV